MAYVYVLSITNKWSPYVPTFFYRKEDVEYEMYNFFALILSDGGIWNDFTEDNGKCEEGEDLYSYFTRLLNEKEVIESPSSVVHYWRLTKEDFLIELGDEQYNGRIDSVFSSGLQHIIDRAEEEEFEREMEENGNG